MTEGLIVTIRRSKTDQEGAGYEKGIARGENPDTCAVTALQEWMAAAGITEGALFCAIGKGGHLKADRLTPQSVALVIKARAGAVRLKAAKYSGHSLRAGMVTQAAKNGASVTDIMQQSGHKAVQTVMRYVPACEYSRRQERKPDAGAVDMCGHEGGGHSLFNTGRGVKISLLP